MTSRASVGSSPSRSSREPDDGHQVRRRGGEAPGGSAPARGPRPLRRRPARVRVPARGGAPEPPCPRANPERPNGSGAGPSGRGGLLHVFGPPGRSSPAAARGFASAATPGPRRVPAEDGRPVRAGDGPRPPRGRAARGGHRCRPLRGAGRAGPDRRRLRTARRGGRRRGGARPWCRSAPRGLGRQRGRGVRGPDRGRGPRARRRARAGPGPLPRPALRGHAARDPRPPRGACRARRGHDGLGLDSGAALASANARGDAQSAGPQAAGGRSRGRRRFRHEDDHLSRGRAHSPDRDAAGPSREVDGEPAGASPERDPLPRAGARGRAGRDARRPDRRLPGPVPARSRGLQPLGDRAAVQHGRPHPRPVPDPQCRSRGACGGDQQDAPRAVPRRRPPRGRVRHGPDPGHARPRSRAGSGRAPAAKPRAARRDAVRRRAPVPGREPARLRRRRLPRRARACPPGRRLRCLPRRPAPASRKGDSPGRGNLLVRRGHRRRAVRGRDHPAGRLREGRGRDRRLLAGARSRDRVRPDRRGRPGDRARGRHGHRRRHRRDPLRHRDLRQPQHRPGGERGGGFGESRPGEARPGRGAAPRGRRDRSRGRGRPGVRTGQPGPRPDVREHRARQPADLPGPGRRWSPTSRRPRTRACPP